VSEELAEYGAAERAEEITQRRGDAVERPLTTTIRWHRPAEQMPPYGMTVVVWIPRLALVMRALRDARHETMWRIAGSAVGGIRNDLVAAWTDAPNGPLPPPDGGAA
jgi:hypothetical protein